MRRAPLTSLLVASEACWQSKAGGQTKEVSVGQKERRHEAGKPDWEEATAVVVADLTAE